MSNYTPPAWIARQRLWSSNSAVSSTNTSLIGLYYMKPNNANVSSGPKLSPSSKSLQITRVNDNVRVNANRHGLQTAKQRSYDRSSILLRQASTENNDGGSDDASMTGNPRSPSSSSTKISDVVGLQQPQEEQIDTKEQDLLHEYARQSEGSYISKERRQRNEESLGHKKSMRAPQPQHDHIVTLRPQQIRRSLSVPEMEKPKTISNDRKHDLRNLIILTRTMKPSVNHGPHAQSSSEDEAVCSGIEDLPTLPCDSLSCVSSLSDDSYNYFSELPSLVQIPPPVRTSNIHNKNLEMYRIGEGEVGRSGDIPHDVKSPSQRLSPATKKDGVPDQLIFTTPGPGTADSPIDEKKSSSSVEQSEEDVQNHNVHDLSRRCRHHRQGSDVRSLEQTRPPPCNQRAISFSTAPTVQNRYATKNQHYKNRKLISGNHSCTQLASLDKPKLLHQRSMSTSAASLTNTTWSSTQYGSHRQNSYTANDSDSFILNGRVVSRAKRRRNRTTSFSPIVSGSRNTQDDQPHITSVYEAVMMGKLSRLELSTSVDSQSANAASSSESSRYNLKNSLSSVDGATMKSSIRITDSSSINGVVSTSSGIMGEEGKRRRRRRSKDELKYFVGKLLPKPIKQIKAVLTKNKTCDLNRSRRGFLA